MADDMRLDYFRPSDRNIALEMYVPAYRQKIANNPNFVAGARDDVKPFNGGNSAAERAIFSAVTASYVDLVEAKANYDNGNANYSRNMRGRYRYIIGRRPPSSTDVLIGVARHTATAPGAVTWANSFDRFEPF